MVVENGRKGGTAQLYALDANFGEAVIRVSRGSFERFLYVEPLTGFKPEAIDPVWAEMTIVGDRLTYIEPLTKRRPLLEVIRQVRSAYEESGANVKHYLVASVDGMIKWTPIEPKPPTKI
jgi:hypothetical protein